MVFPPPGKGEQQEALYSNLLGPHLSVLEPWFKVLRVGGEAHESSEGKEFKEEVMTRHTQLSLDTMTSTLTSHLEVLEGAGGFPTHGTEPSLQPEDPALPREKGWKLSSISPAFRLLGVPPQGLQFWRLGECFYEVLETLKWSRKQSDSEYKTSILKRASSEGFAVRKLFAGLSLWY